MSTSRGRGAGNGAGVQPIPAGSRKIVQSLKEIVNCSETEIYAALKECNMDPNEAVNRLLSQDPFHEVKSKREKKKEGKDTSEPRSRGSNNNSSRTGKTVADRYAGRGGSTPYSYSESAHLTGKSVYKKENGSTPYASNLSSAPDVSGNNRSRVAAGLSDGASTGNKGYSYDGADAVPSGIQPTSGYQPTWVGAPGQVSMADIVKMGRPQNKASNATRLHADHASKDTNSGISSAQQISTYEEWPSIEKPPTIVISSPEYAVDSEQHLEASGVPSDGFNRQAEVEEVEESEDDVLENSGANDMGSDSFSSRKIPVDDSRGASLFENDLYEDVGSYQHQSHDFREADDIGPSVSSVTRNLQQLSVENDDRGLPSEGYTPSVVIPDHLQVQNADCSHLSFGSFGSGMTAAYSSGAVKSMPVETNVEEPHSEPDISSVGHLDTRSSEYYVEDSLRNASDGALLQRSSVSTGNYEPSTASQAEDLKPENADVAHGNQYSFPTSSPGYTDDAQRLNAAFSQTSSQMQNLAPFSDVMQSYTNAIPNNLSPGNAHPSRETDLQYSPFPVTQSMPTKYGSSVSSIGGSAISMSEALKTAGFSSSQQVPHTLSGTSVATGPPLPQHLAVHPYSQHTHPLGPFPNMIYPYMSPNIAYLPSAFQQTFAGNNSYHQSLAAVLPQYKNSISASSLPQSAAGIASGYGAFGNTTNIPGSFAMNPPIAAAPSGTNLNYEEVLSSQYKDNLASLQQQSENNPMWLHSPNSRTMSAVPANTYYNYQGQNQQSSVFRQGQQQPSQNYSALGYPNFYHSQTGVSSLDQQQNPRDGSLGGSQGQQPKQSQLWQSSY